MDTALFPFCLAVFALVGWPLVRVVPAVRNPLLLAPALGYGVTGVAATALYVNGVSVRTVFGLLVAAAVLAALALLRRLATRVWSTRRPSRGAVAFLAVAILGAVLLLLPAWTGGRQFAVFQGNTDDTFGYLTSAAVFAREPYATVVAARDTDILRHPLWTAAANNILYRPTVMVLYATVAQVAPSRLPEMHYGYLAFLFFCAALVLAWLLLNLGWRRPWVALLAGLAFAVGFWGQYVFDLNAWGQIAAVPLLIGLVGVLLAGIGPRQTPDDGPWRAPLQFGWLAVLFTASAFFFYPENTAFHLAALAPVFLWALLRGNRPATLAMSLAVLAGLSVSLLYREGTLDFLLFRQVHEGGAQANFWIHHARFYFGREGWYDALEAHLRQAWNAAHPGMHNDGAAQLSFARGLIVDFFRQHPAILSGIPFDALAGFAGLFFLTPPADVPLAGRFAARLALTGLVILLSVYGLRQALRRGGVGDSGGSARFAAFAAGMLALCGLLVLRQQFWGAGKAVSFGSPYLAVLFLLPLAGPSAAGRAGRAAAGIWLALQLGFGLARPLHARDAATARHTSTSLPVNAARTLYDFDLRPLLRQVAEARCVKLALPDPFLEHYLMLSLYTHGIPFRFDHPVRPVGGDGRTLGLPVWDREADWLVSLPDPNAPGAPPSRGLRRLVGLPLPGARP